MQSAAYVVMSGGLIRTDDLPDDLRDLWVETEGQRRHLVLPCNGDSGIIGPDGEFLAGPLVGEEGILTAKANLGRVMFQKMIADHAGHYTRPDVFTFAVNREPKSVASFAGPEALAEAAPFIERAIANGDIRNGAQLHGAVEDLLPSPPPTGVF
jgi:hypothetical protein